MILFIDRNFDNLISELREVASTLDYKFMYYNPKNATSSSSNKDQIKTELQQFGIKEGSLKLNVCHKACDLFHDNIKIRTIGFVKVAPNAVIPKHVDNKTNRSSVFSIPLTPDYENYKPPTFYEFETNWVNKPFFMPTEKLHSVENNNYERINFQMGFGYSIDEITNLYLNNMLFKNNNQ